VRGPYFSPHTYFLPEINFLDVFCGYHFFIKKPTGVGITENGCHTCFGQKYPYYAHGPLERGSYYPFHAYSLARN
jgi:hypothetical protein